MACTPQARARSALGRGGLGRQRGPPDSWSSSSTGACQGKERHALLVARVVVREKNLPPPPLQGVTHDLKALVEHRETLLREATRHRNRAHAMLTQLRPGYWRVVPALTSTKRLEAARGLVEDDRGIRAELLRDALARVGELESSARALERQIESLVEAS